MSDTQDLATLPEVATQVKLGGWSHPGGGSGSVHQRPHQELQAFLNLLGEFTWGPAWKGLWGLALTLG